MASSSWVQPQPDFEDTTSIPLIQDRRQGRIYSIVAAEEKEAGKQAGGRSSTGLEPGRQIHACVCGVLLFKIRRYTGGFL